MKIKLEITVSGNLGEFTEERLIDYIISSIYDIDLIDDFEDDDALVIEDVDLLI